MSCAYAPSSQVEVLPFNVLKLTTNATIPQNISFSSQLIKSRISIRNQSEPFRSRPKSQIQAFYAPTENAETFYELLGIKENESISDIKKAYKQMARKYHPDISPPDLLDEHTKRFIMVKQAYETLSDPHIRASYDRDLAKGSDFSFSSRTRPCHYNQSTEDRGEWRMRWNSQIDELKHKGSMNSCNGTKGGRMTWGTRMRNQR